MNINKWNAPSRKISGPNLCWRWHIHITHLMPNQLCLYLYLCQLSISFLPGFVGGDKGGQVQLHDIWFIRIYVDTDDFCITWCLYLRTWTHYILHREGTDFTFHYQLLFYYYKNVIYTGGIIINVLISRISKICTLYNNIILKHLLLIDLALHTCSISFMLWNEWIYINSALWIRHL